MRSLGLGEQHPLASEPALEAAHVDALERVTAALVIVVAQVAFFFRGDVTSALVVGCFWSVGHGSY